MNLKFLSSPFPRNDVHWRAQTITKNGDKALALAYLDARDVMDRFDAVCGPEKWQDKYEETTKGRIICSIGIKVRDEWVWKSDGAGETAKEGEKGGISDALKRAAVHWGVGRYLYRLKSVWVPCETADYNNKKSFKKFTQSPWDVVGKDAPKSPDELAKELYIKVKKSQNPAETLRLSPHQKEVSVLVPNQYQHILLLIPKEEKEAA